jgi:ABC-type oligopeptide transport system substrate-binding subunit
MKTMKSLLKLVLLMSLCGIMLLAAACGEETKAPAADTPVVPEEPEAPAVNPHDAPEGTFIGVLDMTDSYTLVPFTLGADAEDRRGRSCEEG